MRNRSTTPAESPALSPKKSPTIPEKDSQAAIAARIKSILRKTLLASPDFPRFYADVVISSAPNSKLAKVLRDHYHRIVGTHMPIHTNVQSCTHIKVTGVRCGSPALRGEQFCYFHQRMVRGVRTPPQARLHPIALIEDEESIQAALMEVINALMRNTIDLKRATLILRALHIAVKNAQRARFNYSRTEAVSEIPEYTQPAEAHPKTEFDFPSTAAPKTNDEEVARREATDFRETFRAGGEALASQSAQAKQRLAEVLKTIHHPTTPPRKPPATVKEVPAAKQRKIAAHSLP